MKKLFSYILAAAIVLSVFTIFPGPVFAVTTGSCGSALTWTFDEESGVLTISGTGDMSSLTDGAPWKAFLQDIKKIEVGDGVTSIGSFAFRNCSAATEIVLPESVVSIERCAFQECTSLKKVNIPNGLKEAGDSLFNGCSSLETTVYRGIEYIGSGSNPYIILIRAVNKDIRSCVLHEGSRFMQYLAFSGCTSIRYVVFPEGWKEIPGSMLYNCQGLTKLSIPRSVRSIGYQAFTSCSKIADIYYSGTEEEWAGIDFGNGNNLLKKATVHYGESLVCPEDASGVCGEDLTWDYDCTYGTLTISGSGDMYDFAPYGGYAAPWADFCEFIFFAYAPSGMTSVGDYAFAGCSLMNEAALNGSVQRIGNGAFMGCVRLWNAGEIKGVKTIGDAAFYGCSLFNTSFGSTIEYIGDYAFYGCEKLSSGLYCGLLEYVGDFAFCGCTNMEIPNLYDCLRYLGDYAFSGCKSYYYQYNEYENGVYLRSTTNPYFIFVCPEDDAVTSMALHKDTKHIISGAFGNYESLSGVTLPSGLISIGGYAFYGCTALKKLTVPGSVEHIGDFAFFGSALSGTFTVPANVQSIGAGIFGGCASLTNLSVDAKNTVYYSAGNCIIERDAGVLVAAIENSALPDDGSITAIGDGAFAGFANITSFSVPEGVVYIGQSAFADCTGLKELCLPDGLLLIDSGAFYGCTALETVYYLGVPKNIEDLLIGIDNECMTNAKLIFVNFEPGDINLDDSLDIKDVLMLRRILAGLEEETEDDVRYGDINDDGSLNIKDVLKLRRKIAGLE